MVLLLKNVLFTLVVPGTVGVYAPLLIARGRSPSGPLFALAAALLALVPPPRVVCGDFATFDAARPPIDAPKRLVVELYRYTRNPMYVGVLLIILGWAVMFTSGALLVYAHASGRAFICSSSSTRRTAPEKFGRQYDDYCAHVHRWLPGSSVGGPAHNALELPGSRVLACLGGGQVEAIGSTTRASSTRYSGRSGRATPGPSAGLPRRPARHGHAAGDKTQPASSSTGGQWRQPAGSVKGFPSVRECRSAAIGASAIGKSQLRVRSSLLILSRTQGDQADKPTPSRPGEYIDRPLRVE
jgi:protein-S-isoprenylcysteine O-methyltransferase Ste14